MTTWNSPAVQRAVEAARELVRADGADLELVSADERRGRIVMRLDVSGLRCEDGGACLVPKALLEPMLLAAMQRELPGEFELRLQDPRQP
ncbi:MAG TPA: hypothetical protein VLK85_05780 [Ramlibacter sp.]|nr:hypothetical protein [Ramlibacter sp.]